MNFKGMERKIKYLDCEDRYNQHVNYLIMGDFLELNKIIKWGEKISLRKIISSDVLFSDSEKNCIFQLSSAINYFLNRLLEENEVLLGSQINRIRLLLESLLDTEMVMGQSINSLKDTH